MSIVFVLDMNFSSHVDLNISTEVEHLKRNSVPSIILYSISNAVKQCSLPSASYSLLISQAWEKREECLQLKNLPTHT